MAALVKRTVPWLIMAGLCAAIFCFFRRFPNWS